MTIEGISIEPLEKAYKKFEQFLDLIDDKSGHESILYEQSCAATIQAFEYTLELSWKTMRRIMSASGIENLNTPKAIFRQAAVIGLINDPTAWFRFIEIRNMTSHTYNQDTLEEVVAIFPTFKSAALDLLINLRRLA